MLEGVTAGRKFMRLLMGRTAIIMASSRGMGKAVARVYSEQFKSYFRGITLED